MTTTPTLSPEDLKKKIIDLGPWHIDIEVTPGLSTAAVLEKRWESEGKVDKMPTFVSPKEKFLALMKRIYPDGLNGRTFLECACNCGAYCFWAREMGGGDTFGFDVRQHWIDQAKFLLEHRQGSKDGMRFEIADVYDLPKMNLPKYDIVMYQGIFYHLPDPVTALKGAADLAGELIYVDTAIRTGQPDGMMALAREGTDTLMTGVYGLAWYPTGPAVIESILHWLGFKETRVVQWRSYKSTRQGRQNIGRVRVIGSRTPKLLENLRPVTAPTEVERQEGGMRDRQKGMGGATA